MAIFSSIAAGASAVGLRPQSILEPIGNIFGGGSSCSQEQKQQKKQIADAIRKYLSAEDIANVTAGMNSNPAPTPEGLADFYVGGRDCKHKNVGSGDQRFLDRLPGLIEKRRREAQAAAPDRSKVSNVSAAAPMLSGFAGMNPFVLVAAIGAVVFGIIQFSK